jgi:hypothetical protein
MAIMKKMFIAGFAAIALSVFVAAQAGNPSQPATRACVGCTNHVNSTLACGSDTNKVFACGGDTNNVFACGGDTNNIFAGVGCTNGTSGNLLAVR